MSCSTGRPKTGTSPAHKEVPIELGSNLAWLRYGKERRERQGLAHQLFHPVLKPRQSHWDHAIFKNLADHGNGMGIAPMPFGQGIDPDI